MKLNWFTRKGIIYLPASLIGWVIFAAALAYAVYIFIDIDRRSHSVSDTLINFVSNLLLIGLVYTVIAYFTEKKPIRNSEPRVVD
jgi:glucan phosphoethanolaminetransferase (alkaline phosphatase superfamily)